MHLKELFNKTIEDFQLLQKLKFASNMLNKKLSKEFKTYKNITEQQFSLLEIISLAKKNNILLNQNDISTLFNVNKANTTTFINRMEKLNYIKRVFIKEDRRVCQIVITEIGLKKLDEVRPLFNLYLSNLLKPLKESDKDSIIIICDKLIDNNNSSIAK